MEDISKCYAVLEIYCQMVNSGKIKIFSSSKLAKSQHICLNSYIHLVLFETSASGVNFVKVDRTGLSLYGGGADWFDLNKSKRTSTLNLKRYSA